MAISYPLPHETRGLYMISDYLQTLQNSIFEKNPLLGIFPNPVFEMASMPHLQTLLSAKPTATVNRPYSSCTSSSNCESVFLGSKISLRSRSGNKKQKPATVVAAFGDVSSDGTTYLIAGAAAVALLGTGFPILFSRKDL